MKSSKLLAIALLLTLANMPTEAQRLKSSSGSTFGYFEGVRRIEAVLYFFFFFY